MSAARFGTGRSGGAPMSITTARALDALPEGTMIRDHMGDLHVSFLTYREKLPRWQEVGMDEWRDSEDMVREIGGGFIILYRPDSAARWTWDCGCETWDAEGSDDGVPWHGREYANIVHGIGIEKHHGREVTP